MNKPFIRLLYEDGLPVFFFLLKLEISTNKIFNHFCVCAMFEICTHAEAHDNVCVPHRAYLYDKSKAISSIFFTYFLFYKYVAHRHI